MKLKLAILALSLFAAACSSSETATPATTTVTEAPTTAAPATIAPATTTPATTSVPKDTGHTHDEEGGHTHETVETTVPEVATTTPTSDTPATTVAPTATTTAPTPTTVARPKRTPDGKISHINDPEGCKRNPHACDDPWSLPHIHILGTNRDGTGEQVINTDPNHRHSEWREHSHEIFEGYVHPRLGDDVYAIWHDFLGGIGTEASLVISRAEYGN